MIKVETYYTDGKLYSVLFLEHAPSDGIGSLAKPSKTGFDSSMAGGVPMCSIDSTKTSGTYYRGVHH